MQRRQENPLGFWICVLMSGAILMAGTWKVFLALSAGVR